MEGNDGTKLGRRALLTAGAAGVAAVAVQAVAGPAAVAAADHDPLKIGEANTGSTETILNAPSSHGLSVSSGAGDGLRGSSSVGGLSGVYGYTTNANGNGVFGRNTGNGNTGSLATPGAGVVGVGVGGSAGVSGQATGTGTGVAGSTANAKGAAVSGVNSAAGTAGFLGGPNGVQGSSGGQASAVEGIATGSGSGVEGSCSGSGRGVTGWATGGGNAVAGFATKTGSGVVGSASGAGDGVVGSASGAGDGVRGFAVDHNGVHGTATGSHGVGVYGENAATKTFGVVGGINGVEAWEGHGYRALRVEGHASFSRSGVLTIAAGMSIGKIASIPISAESYVLATLQQYRSGVNVAAAVPNVAADSISIYLNKKVTAATKVAWFVIDKYVGP